MMYLIHAEGTNLYKIGQSQDPSRRLNELRNDSPVKLGIVGYPGLFPEDFWHWVFADKRQHGEWFELEEADLYLLAQMENTSVRIMQTTASVQTIFRFVAGALLHYANRSDSCGAQ